MVTTVATDVRAAHDLMPDLVGVKSRVCWSAIIGGAVIALACYTALTLFLGAIGITLTEAGVRANAVGIGVLVAMIATMIVSLFVGGWVSSQLTVGENRQEAAIYGFLTWAVVTGVMLCLVSTGVRAGYFAVVGGTMVAQNNERIPAWEETARQAGVPQTQIDSAKNAIDPSRIRAEANDPAQQEKAMQAAVAASWTAFVATMLAMAAAVGGAVVGRGTSFRLFPVARVATRSEGSRIIIPGT